MTDFNLLAEQIESAQSVLRTKVFRQGSSYVAMPLSGRSGSFAAMTLDGDFAILIPLNELTTSTFDDRLESISISFNRRYVVDVEGTPTSESAFASVTLFRQHLALLSGFANLAAVLLSALPETISAGQLLDLLEDFRHLFTSRRQVSAAVVKGLWGELWLMDQVSDPSSWVAGWHIGATDIFDFSFASGRVEVKTTETELRQHHFSLRQLTPGDRRIWIASLRIQPEASGITLGALLESVSSKVTDEAQPLLARKCLSVIAGDLEALGDYRFVASEVESLVLFDSELIPRVLVPPESGISGVAFSVVLGSTPREAEPLKMLNSLTA